MFRRLSLVFQQKANAALDKAEDPNQALDLSYQKLLEQLQQIRRAIADVLTSEKRLEGQQSSLQAQYDKLQGQARQALTQGQEALARTALSRADVIKGQVDSLGPQIEQLKTQESQLEVAGQKLQAKVEAFRTQRETMKAQYTAAKASTAAVEGISGISEHMADVSLMLDRAQDKVSQMQARASAVGQLSDSGVLDIPELGGGDDIDRQLRAASGSDVDSQLAALKAQVALESSQQPAGAIGAAPAAQAAPGAASIGQAASTGAEGIVVRVAGDQQYLLPGSVRPALDGLDKALAAAVESGDAAGFGKATAELNKLIQSNGQKLGQDDLRPSDVIAPSAEMSLEDAKQLYEAGDTEQS
jgi:phage shock protein A